MSKKLLIAVSFLIATSAYSQEHKTLPTAPNYQEVPAKINQVKYGAESSSSRTIWSEDFANGIPASWSQNGNPVAALWEYRGPNTSPNDTIGSRGAFSNLVFRMRGDAIQSPTRSNGFMIFDSDYLDNNGNQSTTGQGNAPPPHIGRLRTGVIDLSAEPAVELTFYTYARRYSSEMEIVISIDGGLTFNDTVVAISRAEMELNEATERNALVRKNISSIVANQSQVVLEFLFDGTTPNSVSGPGLYFWIIDDIELATPPENLLLFSAATAPGTASEAPAQDIIFNGDGSYPKYMHLAQKQLVPITFDANIYNYGSATQTNVALEVEIRDVNNALVTSISSPSAATLVSGDTAYYTTLTTPSWTPSLAGDYTVIYKAISDSIPSITTPTADTISLFSDQKIGLDDRDIVNFFGTNSDVAAMATMFSVEQDDPTGDAGLAHIQGVELFFSLLTDSTGDIEFAIYDTAGFQFGQGFPAGVNPLFTRFFALDASMLDNTVNFSFEASNDRPLTLPTGTYYIATTFFPNAVDGVIRIANSQTFEQPVLASVFQANDGNWFSFFSGSLIFNAPHCRIVLADASDISLNENGLEAFSVYPNPTTGKGFIDFTTPGKYELTVHNMLGDELHRANLAANANEKIAIDFSHLSAGVYLVTLKNKGKVKTVKLSIQ